MFHKDSETVDKIKKESYNNSFDLVEYRYKLEKNYKVHIFTMVIKDQEELLEVWEDICSDIALNFQAELKDDIEIWNIYILFLVKESVNSQVRYLIEQDKYSSRKLVIEGVKNSIDEEYINEVIKEKLFHVSIAEDSNSKNNNEKISQKLQADYNKLYSVIKDSQERPSVLFTKYLEVLKDEF
jgi:hypothetical protein